MKVLRSSLEKSHEAYEYSPSFKRTVIVAPIIIILVQSIFLISERTRTISFYLLEENKPVEIATFLVFLIGGAVSARFILKNRHYFKNKSVFGLYLFLSFVLIIISFEEIAWGQWFFDFETPEKWKTINMQGETTLHNIKGLQGNSELLRMLYGIGGIIAIGFSINPALDKVKAPPILFSWYVIILFHAIIDYYFDFWDTNSVIEPSIQKTSELIELLIAISAVLYLYINLTKIIPREKA